MTDPFATPSDLATGSYFKPADHVSDLVILFEPKGFEANVPNTYNGIQTFRDEVTANVYIFKDSDAVQSKTPIIERDVKVTHQGITRKLGKAMGRVVPGVVQKVTTSKGNQAWSLEDVQTPAYIDSAREFYIAHRAEVDANLAAAPSFSD